MSGRGGVALACGSAAVPVCASKGCVCPWKFPSLLVGSELLLPTDPTVTPMPWPAGPRALLQPQCQNHSAAATDARTPAAGRVGGSGTRLLACGALLPSCVSSDCS